MEYTTESKHITKYVCIQHQIKKKLTNNPKIHKNNNTTSAENFCGFSAMTQDNFDSLLLY